jgi:hypothetical protein
VPSDFRAIELFWAAAIWTTFTVSATPFCANGVIVPAKSNTAVIAIPNFPNIFSKMNRTVQTPYIPVSCAVSHHIVIPTIIDIFHLARM